jgi:hypothetical protein
LIIYDYIDYIVIMHLCFVIGSALFGAFEFWP